MNLHLPSHFLTERNVSLIEVFLVFVGFLFLFGFIYHQLYRRRRNHFAFNSDILATQRADVGKHCADRIAELDVQIKCLQELLGFLEPKGNASKRVYKGVKLASGTEYKIGRRVYFAGTIWFETDYLEIIEQGRTIRVFPFNPVESLIWVFGRGNRVVARLLKRVERNRLDFATQLGTTSEMWPDVWSYLDFVYFATISQTTIGYGDILPNSTTVRVLVMIQVLVAYALLVVVLNVVIG